jgi:hypothetical protein
MSNSIQTNVREVYLTTSIAIVGERFQRFLFTRHEVITGAELSLLLEQNVGYRAQFICIGQHPRGEGKVYQIDSASYGIEVRCTRMKSSTL